MKAHDAARIANLNALTPSQYGAVSNFLSNALWSDRHEVKRGEIRYLYGPNGYAHYALSLDVGFVGDEGTLGESIGRDHYHLFIGPRGKLTGSYLPRFLQQFKGKTALGVFVPKDCTFRAI